jgi:hypothetical protein
VSSIVSLARQLVGELKYELITTMMLSSKGDDSASSDSSDGGWLRLTDSASNN